jgi:transcriptional regulator with GAF, ATPase, and Fis domain
VTTSDLRERDLAEVLAGFAQLLLADHTVQDILDRLAEHCTELLPIHGIGVLLSVDGGHELSVATASTPIGEIVEQLEVDLREGPCSDAVRTGEQVLVPDLEAVADRYPRFAPVALDAGVRSIHGLPMSARTGIVGALNIIAVERILLTPAQIATAQLLADTALAYLVNRRASDDSSRLSTQLQHALDSRVVVEQAKGRLAERHDETVDDAYERIRRHARSNQVTARAVAEAVLRGDLSL